LAMSPESSEQRQNRAPHNPAGRWGKKPPLNPDERAQRRREQQRRASAAARDRARARINALPPDFGDDATLPEDVISDAEKLSPERIARWMRAASLQVAGVALKVATDPDMSTDLRIRAGALVMNQSWLKAPTDPAVLVQIANAGMQPAAATMNTARVQELLAMVRGDKRPALPHVVEDAVFTRSPLLG
jgi:hypothetical protein